MTLAQQNATALDTAFRGRVRQSAYRAATDIVGEDPAITGFSADKTDKRHKLGQQVLSGKDTILEAFYYAVSTDVGDTDDPSTILDSAIDTAVDSVWDDIAGVKFGE